MAVTIFEKPMGAEVETLKGQIGTLSNLTTAAKGSAVGAINELNSKIASKSWSATASDSILSYVLANCENDCLPFSFVKTGSNQPSDSPLGGEFVGLVSGNGPRIHVHLIQYNSSIPYEYERDIFNNSWVQSSWYSLNGNLGNIVNRCEETSVIDFDTETRFLVYTNTSSSTGTKPVTTNNGYLFTFYRAANTRLQIFKEAGVNTTKIYVRTKYNSDTYGDWRYITLTT